MFINFLSSVIEILEIFIIESLVEENNQGR